MAGLDDLMTAAEAEWLAGWNAGPTEAEGVGLPAGSFAPDLVMLDDQGQERQLAEFWNDGPALVMFWRHFGCGCGVGRADRLKAELGAYQAAGLQLVIIGQGEPIRATAYRAEHDIPCPILCDPDHDAYRTYGIGQWPVERILADSPPEYWDHPPELGLALQVDRRAQGRPLVDDPWRAVREYVVGPDGRIRLSYAYQHCFDYPNLAVITAAARLTATPA